MSVCVCVWGCECVWVCVSVCESVSVCECVCACAQLLSHVWLSAPDPKDYSPPDSSVRGILQTRILEWVAISSPGESSQRRDWTSISCLFCIGQWILWFRGLLLSTVINKAVMKIFVTSLFLLFQIILIDLSPKSRVKFSTSIIKLLSGITAQLKSPFMWLFYTL